MRSDEVAVEKKYWVEYQCSWCGTKQTRAASSGRPAPGSCPRKPKMRNGQSKPHTWVINRRY